MAERKAASGSMLEVPLLYPAPGKKYELSISVLTVTWPRVSPNKRTTALHYICTAFSTYCVVEYAEIPLASHKSNRVQR